MRFFGKTAAWNAAAGLALLAIACRKDTPTPTTPTETPAAPTVTERYVGTIGVGGSGFFSFSVSKFGTVNVTLNKVSGIDDPAVGLSVGVGAPSGFGCNATAPSTVTAGSDPQVTGSYVIGIYCVRVADIGNLTGAATFDVTIAHP